MNNWKSIAIAAIGVLAFGAAFFLFFFKGENGTSQGQSLTIEFAEIEGRIYAGVPFVVGASLANSSGKILKNVALAVTLPENIVLAGDTSGQRVSEQSIGDLNAGSVSQRNFDLIAVGDARALKTVQLKATYGIEGSKAVFEQTAKFDIAIGEPAVSLDIAAPQNVFNGENFDITVRYRNTTDQDMKNLKLTVDLPSGYQFQKGDPAPQKGKNGWSIPQLNGLSEGTVKISGSLVGPEQLSFPFKARIAGEALGQEYAVNTQATNVVIATSPLSLSIIPNDTKDYIGSIGDTISYALRYKNNSQVTFENIIVRAALIGDLFDFTTLRSDGDFSSIKNTITWITANTPQLQRLAPGEEGEVRFSAGLKPDFPITRLSDKNYTVKIKGQIESPTVPEGTSAGKTASLAETETKIRGNMTIDAQAFFRDAAAGIVNEGTYPPRVNQPTQYTLHWVIKNYSTDMSAIRVRAFVRSGSRWTGKVKSNTGTAPKYNPTTGEVIWEIPSLPATKGIVSAPAEAIFQIENIPAVTQAGQSVLLLSGTELTAQDMFVNLPVASQDAELDTSIQDDATVANTSRMVEP